MKIVKVLCGKNDEKVEMATFLIERLQAEQSFKTNKKNRYIKINKI